MAIVLGNKNVLRFDLNESREGFCQTGRGRSLHVEGPKTEKAWEPRVVHQCDSSVYIQLDRCHTYT